MLTLSKKLSAIKPSATLAITSVAKKMKKDGVDVVNFSAGEPDFDTLPHIKDAAKQAIDQGFTKYTPSSGMPDLKKAVCTKLLKDNGLRYNESQIVISSGAKHSLYNTFQAICNPGDEVIVIAPYWVSYPEMIRMAGASVKVIETDERNGFKASTKDVKRVINAKTKAIVINSPSNPAGVIYNDAELQAIGELAVSHGFYIISDEIYEKLIYDEKRHVSIASLGDKIHERTVTVNGVSKAYSMTGWRIGYLAGPDDIVKRISVLQSHSTSNPASISQKGALAALSTKEKEIAKMRDEFQSRRDLLMKRLDKISKMIYTKPLGAFYIYCNIRGFGMPAGEFAKKLLEEKHVAVIPGEAFGSGSHVRLSFATSKDRINEGMDRIESWARQ